MDVPGFSNRDKTGAPPAAPARPAGADRSRIPLAGARVTVVGLGKSGAAAAQLLAREGAVVTVADEKPAEALLDRAATLPKGSRACFGDAAGGAFSGAALIVLSPGVPRTFPGLAEAEAAGTPVIAEVELAARCLSAPLLGITGTNGKSTVTALVGHIMKAWKPNVFVGGNFGDPLCTAVLSGTPWDVLVVELSSFQLEDITSFAPQVAALLNLRPDHMDRYKSAADYYRAKFRIFEFMKGGYALLNAAEESTPMVIEHYLAGARPVLFNLPPDDTRDGVRVADGVMSVTIGGARHPIIDTARLAGISGYALENAQAGAAICLLAGCPLPVVREALVTFTGLPHRVQKVAEVNGVTYIDDSKATNPAAVVHALAGMTGEITLLLGGRDKKGDLFTLREPVFSKTRRVILFGEARDLFRLVLRGYPDLTVVETLKDAVRAAHEKAAPGEIVLLSPACASFDEFTGYAARGDAFRSYAEALR